MGCVSSKNRSSSILLGTLLGLIILLSLVGTSTSVSSPTPNSAPSGLAWVFSLLIAGLALAAFILFLRLRRAHHRELTEKAVEAAIIDERLRIASHLHDIISDGLGTISLTAQVSSHLSRSPADSEAHQALRDISATAKETTQQLRSLLALLRNNEGGAQTLPTSILSRSDIPYLIERAESRGLTVTFHDGARTSLSPSIDHLIGACIAEGLSNILRHCGPTQAHIDIRQTPTEILCSITDQGPIPGWQAHAGSGAGLSLLAANAARCGARLDYGPHSHGFSVRLACPLEGDSR